MSGPQFTFKSFLQLLKSTYEDWNEDNALRLSAALAYYSIFSIAPLLVISISVASWIFGEEAAHGMLHHQLSGLLGSSAAEGVQEMVKSADKPASSIMAGIGGGAALLMGAGGVFGQLKDALNTIWEVKPKPNLGVFHMAQERLLSFGMVLVIGFLLLVSLFFSAATSAITKSLDGVFPGLDSVSLILGTVLSFAIVSVLFASIFKFLPDAKVGWKHVWSGATATALLFEIGKVLLGLYLGRESVASPYGAAGSAVVLLLWVYYASLILFFGAEFTQVYAKACGDVILPDKDAVAMTEDERKQHGLGEPSEPPVQVPGAQPGGAELRSEPELIALRNPFAILFGSIAGGFLFGLILRKLTRRETLG